MQVGWYRTKRLYSMHTGIVREKSQEEDSLLFHVLAEYPVRMYQIICSRVSRKGLTPAINHILRHSQNF